MRLGLRYVQTMDHAYSVQSHYPSATIHLIGDSFTFRSHVSPNMYAGRQRSTIKRPSDPCENTCASAKPVDLCENESGGMIDGIGDDGFNLDLEHGCSTLRLQHTLRSKHISRDE